MRYLIFVFCLLILGFGCKTRQERVKEHSKEKCEERGFIFSETKEGIGCVAQKASSTFFVRVESENWKLWREKCYERFLREEKLNKKEIKECREIAQELGL